MPLVGMLIVWMMGIWDDGWGAGIWDDGWGAGIWDDALLRLTHPTSDVGDGVLGLIKNR